MYKSAPPPPPARVFPAASGPNWCWHCGQKLYPAPRGQYGPGVYYGTTIRDQLGNPHRIHIGCEKRCKASMARLSAAASEKPEP